MTIGVAAIIQARMGSTRLPGKSLAPIMGKPLLQHLIERVKLASLVDDLVIATTLEDQDDGIVALAEELGVKCFRGSATDVLDRTYQAARRFNVENVVRITGDCPLADPKVIDLVVGAYLSGEYDYVTNTLTYPDAIGLEIFSQSVLEEAWKESQDPTYREHVTGYIRNSDRFRSFEVRNDVDLSHYKWSVDTEQDLAFVRSVFEKLGSNSTVFSLEDILQALKDCPELGEINRESVRDAGYYRSIAGDSPVPSHELTLDRSHALVEKGLGLIPSDNRTFHNGPDRLVSGVPIYLARGQGSRVWDVDGNEYIDYQMGDGAVILGHNYPLITEAVISQLQEGVPISSPNQLELELAQLLVETIPSGEMVWFGKNDFDATSGALAVARAFTGRYIIAACAATVNKGLPEVVQQSTVPFHYSDISSLENIFAQHPGQVAAVIMEPIVNEESQDQFLQEIEEITHREEALLVFDETFTGFRLDLGGAQEFIGVAPDLSCYGIAMANGFPLSAVVGRREVMRLFGEVSSSITPRVDAIALAASIATIQELRRKDVTSHLWGQGRKLKDGYNTLAHEFGMDQFTECAGMPAHTVITFNDGQGAGSQPLQNLFRQECLNRGVMFNGSHNVSFSHTNHDVDHTLRVYRTVLELLGQAVNVSDAVKSREGQVVRPSRVQASKV